jgi:choline dehydrogenase-like flavoprotein
MSILSEYDFIVIGGGTSGLVVAARLSEDPTAQVLVLEAGENHLEDPRINIPALWPSLLGTELDWNFTSVPQVRSHSFLRQCRK